MIAASTIAPIAIAIPPSDIMFAFNPWNFITSNAASTAVGNVKIATSELRK